MIGVGVEVRKGNVEDQGLEVKKDQNLVDTEEADLGIETELKEGVEAEKEEADREIENAVIGKGGLIVEKGIVEGKYQYIQHY